MEHESTSQVIEVFNNIFAGPAHQLWTEATRLQLIYGWSALMLAGILFVLFVMNWQRILDFFGQGQGIDISIGLEYREETVPEGEEELEEDDLEEIEVVDPGEKGSSKTYFVIICVLIELALIWYGISHIIAPHYYAAKAILKIIHG